MSAGNRFDRTADRYAAHAARAGVERVRRLVRAAGRPTACWTSPAGRAHWRGALLGSVASVTVLDSSPRLLEHVPAGVERVVGRAEQLPFGAGAFDLVTCVNSLHHIARPARALDEMARVLAPGGRIVLEDMVADPDGRRARRWEEIERLRDPEHGRLIAPGEARGPLQAQGLHLDAEELWLRTSDVAAWLEVAGCTGTAAARVREMIGASEFEVRVWRARYRRPRRSSAPNGVRPLLAHAGSGCADDRCAPVELVHELSQLALEVVGRAHRVARLPLPARLGDAHAVHQSLDVPFVQHRGSNSAFDVGVRIPSLRYMPARREGIVTALMVKVLIAALLGTVVGIVVMIVVIVAAGGKTEGASSIGLNLSLSTAAASRIDAREHDARRAAAARGGSSTGGGGNAAAGKTLFASNGCGSCHTLAVAGATGTIGPDLGKVVAGDAAKDHMPIGAFIQQSITDPAAFTATGGPWATPMPTTFGSSLSPSSDRRSGRADRVRPDLVGRLG